MERFKVGDKVISIHNFRKIKYGDVCTVKSFRCNSNFEQSIRINNDKNFYFSNNFITFVEFRKRKIEKIRLCTK